MTSNKKPLLTTKETQVCTLLAKGLLYKEIANLLGVNINTIKKHCKNIYKKLQVRNRTEATIKFNSIKAA
jgi:two-component system, NarL family, response regulator LiaR